VTERLDTAGSEVRRAARLHDNGSLGELSQGEGKRLAGVPLLPGHLSRVVGAGNRETDFARSTATRVWFAD